MGQQRHRQWSVQEPQRARGRRSGNVYVADTGNHRVQKFSSSFVFQAKWGRNGGDGTSGSGNGQFNSPGAITIGNDGLIYVADTKNHRVQVFNSSSAFQWLLGNPGIALGEFDEPRGIVVDSNLNIFVAEADNDRIQRFDPA